MKRVYEIILQLRAASGSIAKKAILEENIDNALFKQFIFFTYEPTISYYQKKIVAPTNSMFSDVTEQNFTQEVMKSVVNTLAERRITGNAAVTWLGDLYNSLTETMEYQGKTVFWARELLTMMIEGSIDAGVSIGTFNKVWDDLITSPPYMRCSLPKDVDLETFQWEEGVDSEIKYDGEFADYFIFRNGDVRIRTRNGNTFIVEPFEKSTYALQDLTCGYFFDMYPREDYLVYNGEFEMLDLATGQVLPRQEGNGILNSILKSGENSYDGKEPIYSVWDFIPGSKYEEGLFDMPRKERRAHLTDAFSVSEFEGIKLAERRVCHSYEEAVEHYEECRALGLEGTVIKDPRGPWFDGTSKFQVKVKEMKDVDLVVVGYRPGKKKFAGMVGSVLCETSDGLLQVGVSGISESDRQMLTDNPDHFLGMIVTVTSNGIMYAKKGKEKKHSLFLPRMAQDDKKNILWRNKNEADSFDRVEAIFAEKKKK